MVGAEDVYTRPQSVIETIVLSNLALVVTTPQVTSHGAHDEFTMKAKIGGVIKFFFLNPRMI